jgi:hypothetical protein
MIVEEMTQVKTLDFLSIYQVGMIEKGSILVNLGNSSKKNFTNFPLKRYELLFPFLRKCVKLEFIFSFYFNNEQLIRYIIRQKDGFFVRTKNPDHIVILHFFHNSFPF